MTKQQNLEQRIAAALGNGKAAANDLEALLRDIHAAIEHADQHRPVATITAPLCR
jgi:hypothetical protein